ncbi:protoporphyrinogen oxidase [Candidatus Poribacteria bacterium]|nr:MAG: protoporphyrinogen oxidase [Candidatus Poribacteria bacterium]
MMTKQHKRAIVIGGGITGLSAAYRLKNEAAKRDIPLNIKILEASNRIGGVIKTEHKDGFVIEHGPDAFISTKPWAKELCEELGIDQHFIGTNSKVRRSFVVRNKKLIPVPEGFYMMAPGSFLPFIKTPIFSLKGKLRILLDLFISPKENTDTESVADFVRRRLGTEAFERMAQPMIGGIYTSDAENLSLKATFPRFLEMEKEHGSIIKALIKQKKKASQTTKDTSGPRYSLFLSFTNGMQTIVDTLANEFSECIQLNTTVKTIHQNDTDMSWQVVFDDDTTVETDLLCIALPAPHASCIIKNVFPTIAEKLNDIPYTSSTTVNMAFRRVDITHPLNGMGFVVPIKEQLNLIGCSFSSVKFENRAPEDNVLIRAFVGENTSQNIDLKDVVSEAINDVSGLLGIETDPIFTVVSQHHQSMAQYLVGHQNIISDIQASIKNIKGFTLAGNAYTGIGIPDCIHSGEQAALSLLNSP